MHTVLNLAHIERGERRTGAADRKRERSVITVKKRTRDDRRGVRKMRYKCQKVIKQTDAK